MFVYLLMVSVIVVQVAILCPWFIRVVIFYENVLAKHLLRVSIPLLLMSLIVAATIPPVVDVSFI